MRINVINFSGVGYSPRASRAPLWEGGKCAPPAAAKTRKARLVSESAKRFKSPLLEGAGREAAGGVTAQREPPPSPTK